jgi:hypothetical protein
VERSVGDDDLRVPQAGSNDPFARSGDRWLGDICAKDMTAWADTLRRLKNCRAGAATNIQYAPGWGAAKSKNSFVRAVTARSIRAYWSAHARVAALFQIRSAPRSLSRLDDLPPSCPWVIEIN